MIFSAVLFDLDGTLIDSKRLYLECYRRALVPLLEREPTREEIMALKPRSELQFLAGVVGEEELPACREAFHGHYAALYETHFDGVYPGVRELLAELRRAGARTGIVTGKSRRSWDATPAAASLGPFDALVFEDDVPVPKPDPAGLRLALEALGERPESALYVGDTMGDVHAALAAGMRPAAVLWSRHDPDYLERFAAGAAAAGAALLEEPSDLLGLGRAVGGTLSAPFS